MSSFQSKLKTPYGITIGIHNKHRSGKTLTAIYLIILYLIDREYVKGIISNVHLKNLDSLGYGDYYKPLQDIKNIKQEEYKNYILFTDEIRRLVDSRMSPSFKNRFISNLLADTGKFKQIHIYTDQEYGAVDKRIKVNVDAVLYPIIDLRKDRVVVYSFENYRQFELAMWEDGFLQKWDAKFSFTASKFYDYYDTEQPIDDYRLTFTPKEYAVIFFDWLKDTGYEEHTDFKLTGRTINLWKQETGEYINSEQQSALLEWMKYNTDFKMSGRKNEDVE